MKIDNRDYFYKEDSKTYRVEYPIFLRELGKSKSVIDFGAGDFSLLELIRKEKGIKRLVGLEKAVSGQRIGKKKGFEVVDKRYSVYKTPYKDKEFDALVCSVSFQMFEFPEKSFEEMRRISKKQIISIINFAFMINRFQLLFMGRMPRFMLFGYSWYSTGIYHQCSIKDFEDFLKERRIENYKIFYVYPFPIRKLLEILPFLKQVFDKFGNFFAMIAVFSIE